MTSPNFKIINGKELPRVTHILKVLSKGEGFEKWLKTHGNNADYLLKEAGFIGTDFHNIAENIGKGISLPEIKEPKVKGWVDEFNKWITNNVKTFIETERDVSTDRYCGTLDSLVELKDGKIAVLDYKTSKYIYDTHWLQVSAYWKAYEEMTNVKISTAFILRFEKGDKEPVMEVKEIEDIDYLSSIFNKVVDIWYWKNKTWDKK